MWPLTAVPSFLNYPSIISAKLALRPTVFCIEVISVYRWPSLEEFTKANCENFDHSVVAIKKPWLYVRSLF
ncbi:hypothetical protein RSOLAG1IB_09579 [Rhizoctonia solani AG-1 IB]|uniref:Uncharacterized protein n=1 Tax=Thanatephorus cucumeris (strain AG1-IB / isolate 7/3/14) TaxID=1108050 RepID=A0A0B7FQT4_THACB|nr:hypothetical protein RSOLAG1IB_09579 [Rhizoctonia solani AG-1 IB]